jgi:uncharacterized membrane protein YhaH (DUF805 family)
MEWYLKVLKNYANFEGRARRKEYWMFVLFHAIFCCVAVFIDFQLGSALETGFLPVTIVYALALIIPSIAVVVRRLHDIGKSGWMYLVGFIPVIGGIWILILMVTDGTPGPNEYGPNPKEGYVPLGQ